MFLWNANTLRFGAINKNNSYFNKKKYIQLSVTISPVQP